MVLSSLVAGLLVVTGVPAAVAVQPGPEPVVPGIQAIEPEPSEAGTVRLRREGTRPFRAYAVTWPSGRPAPELTVRVHQGGGWTDWRELDVDPAGRTGPRSGAGLVWTGPSDGIEILAEAAPRGLRVELIDPRDVPGDHVAPPAGDDAETPTIHRRADWGADESKMTWDPEYADRLVAITLHHTATSNDYRAEDVPKLLRSIYHYQAVSLGWGDIGYHVLVDRYGRLWEGRTGGLDRPVIGAHAGGFNTGTAGIGILGHHSDTAVPAGVVAAAARYVAWRFAPYDVDPRGSTRLTGGPSSKYPDRVTITVSRVFPHRQTSATECPGEHGMAALQPIRDKAYEYGE